MLFGRARRASLKRGRLDASALGGSLLIVAAVLALCLISVGSLSAARPTAKIACTRDVAAVVGGKHECLGSGEYCATRYEREYERYGFVCSTHYRPPRLRRE